MSDPIIRPSETRICRQCENLVTNEPECPSCGKRTSRHPEADVDECYCVDCAKGPFQSGAIHVVTLEEDPYQQCDDGTLITICEPCKNIRDNR